MQNRFFQIWLMKTCFQINTQPVLFPTHASWTRRTAFITLFWDHCIFSRACFLLQVRSSSFAFILLFQSSVWVLLLLLLLGRVILVVTNARTCSQFLSTQIVNNIMKVCVTLPKNFIMSRQNTSELFCVTERFRLSCLCCQYLFISGNNKKSAGRKNKHL